MLATFKIMEWIKITDENLPPFKKNVVITDEELNKEEGRFLTAVSMLNGTWQDEAGKKPEWDDINNSGIIHPTHFCIIPELKSDK
tara:strand:+ start:944 stop:1198 length:255 start_codon:yes stop_codon:yes gene_type:complete